jgi:hypothetical protein
MCVVQVSDCTNFYTERACPHDPSQSCMVWMAGSFIAPGSEVCHSYKYMPNDKAMLQYGFLQVGTIWFSYFITSYCILFYYCPRGRRCVTATNTC